MTSNPMVNGLNATLSAERNAMLKVGDYVIPIDDDGDEYDHIWTPCRVTHLFKNGNLRASSDAGTLSWHGQADAFKLAPNPT